MEALDPARDRIHSQAARTMRVPQRLPFLYSCFPILVIDQTNSALARFTLTPPNIEYARMSSGRGASSSSLIVALDSELFCRLRRSILRPPNTLKPSHTTSSSGRTVTLAPPNIATTVTASSGGADVRSKSSPPKRARPKNDSPRRSMLPSILFPEKIARLTMTASIRVLDIAVGGRVGRCGENIHRRQRRTAFALQVRELGLGLGFGVALADCLELVAEFGAGDFVIHARLREHPLNRLAHFFERAHVVVGRNLLERALDSHPRLRVPHPRDHPHLLDLELFDLALERDQILLRVLGFRRQLAELFAQPGAIAVEDVLALNENQRALILVHIGGLPRFLIDLLHLGQLFAQLALELVAHVDNAGGRGLELMIALHAVRDCGLVDRLGIARLARFNPAAELASEQFEKS